MINVQTSNAASINGSKIEVYVLSLTLARNALAAAAGITVVIFIHSSLTMEHRLIDDRFNADHNFAEQCFHCLVDVLTGRSTCLKERHAATKQ